MSQPPRRLKPLTRHSTPMERFAVLEALLDDPGTILPVKRRRYGFRQWVQDLPPPACVALVLLAFIGPWLVFPIGFAIMAIIDLLRTL